MPRLASLTSQSLIGLGLALPGDAIPTYIINSSFDSVTGPTYLSNPATIRSIATQTDNKIIVAGYMDTIDGTAVGSIARLNVDGSLDTTFNPGGAGATDTGIAAVAVNNGTNKIVAGGQFTSFNGTTSNNIVGLNSDGTIDTGFDSQGGFNNQVNSVAIGPDGKILVGGFFTSAGGVATNRIYRMNSDGTRDSTFVTGGGFNIFVYSVAVQSDLKVLVGGNFIRYDGITVRRIARLNVDGSLDTTFNSSGVGFDDGTVYAIHIDAGGGIWVGGDFTAYNGSPADKLIKLNSDGSVDTSFVNGGFSTGSITSIDTDPNGKPVIGGTFTTYAGQKANRIVKLTQTGAVDELFNTGDGFSGFGVYTVKLHYKVPEYKILVGGSFNSYNGISQNGLSALTYNPSLLTQPVATPYSLSNINTASDDGFTFAPTNSSGGTQGFGRAYSFWYSPNGKIFEVGVTDGSAGNHFVNRYTTNGKWDLVNNTYAGQDSLNTSASIRQGQLNWSTDGLVRYSGFTGSSITSRSRKHATAYDFTSSFTNPVTVTDTMKGKLPHPDGTQFYYTTGQDTTIRRLTLQASKSLPNFFNSNQNTNFNHTVGVMQFAQGGRLLFVCDPNTFVIYKYYLNTPYDISSYQSPALEELSTATVLGATYVTSEHFFVTENGQFIFICYLDGVHRFQMDLGGSIANGNFTTEDFQAWTTTGSPFVSFGSTGGFAAYLAQGDTLSQSVLFRTDVNNTKESRYLESLSFIPTGYINGTGFDVLRVTLTPDTAGINPTVVDFPVNTLISGEIFTAKPRALYQYESETSVAFGAGGYTVKFEIVNGNGSSSIQISAVTAVMPPFNLGA